MKRTIIYFLSIAISCITGIAAVSPIASAKTITPDVAQIVAANFFRQNTNVQVKTISLAYTAISSAEDTAYFVFNINANNGFVIVVADDAELPVIGYSSEGPFAVPNAASGIGYWMEQRKNEIISNKNQKIEATPEITAQWATYLSNKQVVPKTQSVVVGPLVPTKWDQVYPYSALCPGLSVTGCVATTMAQIMRYWKYPAKGIGTSSYNSSYGILSADYGNTPYNWNNMDTVDINVFSIDVATLMYQCGVSVQMQYTANNSSASVTVYDDPYVNAQTSYCQYFGYNAATMQGLQRSNYSDNDWLNIIENELNAKRPTEYVGYDPVNGGHSWVCDGYEANNYFHMNWGWGGTDDGYFSINSLNPANTGFNFSQGHEVLIGIEPPPAFTNNAAVLSITSPGSTTCDSSMTPVVELQNLGTTTLTSCTINYYIDGNLYQTYDWTGSLDAGSAPVDVTLPSMSVNSSIHAFTASAGNPNNTSTGAAAIDQATDSFTVAYTALWPPLTEGFEGSVNLPEGWSIWNPNNDVTWQIVTTAAYQGNNCIGFNNCYGDDDVNIRGRRDRFITMPYNLLTDSNARLSFAVAYSPDYNSGHLYTDTLAIYYSLDCGATWTLSYIKGGNTLATAPEFNGDSGCWSPSSSQWRIDAVDLSSLVGRQSVMLAFENRSGWGGWLYIDNIELSGAKMSLDSITVYPNPAGSEFTVEGLSKNASVQYSLYNMLGEQVEAAEIPTDGRRFYQVVPTANLAAGVYYIRVIDNSYTATAKVVVK